MLVGENHRVFLPASLLTGALVMSLADIFVLLTGLFLALAILLIFVAKPKAAAGGGGGH